MSRFLHAPLILTVLLLAACSEPPPDAAPPQEAPHSVPPKVRSEASPKTSPEAASFVPTPDLPLPKAFQRSLKGAPSITRKKILLTCNKWVRADGSCDPIQVRRDQIACWWQRGERELKYTQDVGFGRRRAIDHRIMLLQDLCMEMRYWLRRDRPEGRPARRR